jgi:hypothetical protein
MELGFGTASCRDLIAKAFSAWLSPRIVSFVLSQLPRLRTKRILDSLCLSQCTSRSDLHLLADAATSPKGLGRTQYRAN